MSSKPIYRASREERLAALLPHVGLEVELDVWPNRSAGDGGNYKIRGELVAVCTTNSGNATDLAVVRRRAGDPSSDFGVSLATVHAAWKAR